MMEFYTSRIRKAKKTHICEMCGEKIHAGERYSCESGKYEGSLFTRKLHLDCRNVMNGFCEEVNNEFCYDEITDWWQDSRCGECKYYDTDFCDDNGMDKKCWCLHFERMDGDKNT